MPKIRKPKPIVCQWRGPLRDPSWVLRRLQCQPKVSGQLYLPRRHLQAYEDVREASPLGKSFLFAGHVFEDVDAIVVVGSQHDLRPIRALTNACLQPYHNESSRSDRGCKPRFYLVDQRRDDDHVAAVLERLAAFDPKASLPQRCWGLIILGANDSVPAASVFEAAFEQQSMVPSRCKVRLSHGEDSPVGIGVLYAAAAVGLDTIQLLVGAMAVSDSILGSDLQGGNGVSVHERLVECFAARPRWQEGVAALDQWECWYRQLGSTSQAVMSMSASRPREMVRFEPSDRDVAIRLPVIDTLAMGTLFQAAILGHAVATA